MALSQGLSWIGAAVLVVMLPRYLGDVNLGRLGFALAFTSLASLVANLGTATYVTKEIARDPTRAGHLTGAALVTRVPLSLAAAAITVAVVNLGGFDATTKTLIYLLSAWILIDPIRIVLHGALQGLQRMAAYSSFGVVSNTVYAGLAALLLIRGAGPVPVAAAYVLGQAAGLALIIVMLWRHARPRFTLHGVGWGALLAGGLPYFVWQASLVVYGQIDTVLLSVMTNNAVVGWYVAAYRFISIPSFVPVILATVMFPALSAASRRPAEFNPIARRTMHLTVVLCVPMSLGIILIANRLIPLLGYPPSFRNSVVPIVLLAAGFPLVAADMVIGTLLNTLDRQRAWALTGLAAAVLNPLANLVAIPLSQEHLGNGAVGAAAVTTATEGFLMAVGLVLLRRGTFDLRTLGRLGRCLPAGLAMALVVILLQPLPLPVTVAGGAAAYSIAALWLRAISIAEVRQLLGFLLRRRGEAVNPA
jgi:O-antigen/teichoic acid export membrane protein